MGWSQTDLATTIGVDKSTIWRAEDGQGKDLKTVKKIADALGVPVLAIMRRLPNRAPAAAPGREDKAPSETMKIFVEYAVEVCEGLLEALKKMPEDERAAYIRELDLGPRLLGSLRELNLMQDEANIKDEKMGSILLLVEHTLEDARRIRKAFARGELREWGVIDVKVDLPPDQPGGWLFWLGLLSGLSSIVVASLGLVPAIGWYPSAMGAGLALVGLFLLRRSRRWRLAPLIGLGVSLAVAIISLLWWGLRQAPAVEDGKANAAKKAPVKPDNPKVIPARKKDSKQVVREEDKGKELTVDQNAFIGRIEGHRFSINFGTHTRISKAVELPDGTVMVLLPTTAGNSGFKILNVDPKRITISFRYVDEGEEKTVAVTPAEPDETDKNMVNVPFVPPDINANMGTYVLKVAPVKK
jgi:transcriptional regulator with XRE-family HTH domain